MHSYRNPRVDGYEFSLRLTQNWWTDSWRGGNG